MEQTSPTHQTNVIILGKQKSVGVAFLLSFLFGPLGLLYASILGGIVMFILGIALFFLLPIVGGIIAWIASIIWAIVAAKQANAKMGEQAKAAVGR